VLPVQSAKAASIPIAQPAQEQSVAKQSQTGRESSEIILNVKEREAPSTKSKSVTTQLSMTRQGSSGEVEKGASSPPSAAVSLPSKPQEIAGGFLPKLPQDTGRTAEDTTKPQETGDKPSASSPSKPRLDTQADSKPSSGNPNDTTNQRQLDVGDSAGSVTSAKGLNISKDRDGSVNQKENVSAAGSSPIRLSATSADAVKVPQNLNPAPTSQSIAEQIAESVSGSTARGDGNIVVRLNPPELGTVVMKFQQEGDEVNGLLEVSKSQTKYEIEQVLPQILRSLQDGGIQIKKLEVVLMDQSGVTADKGQTGNGPSAGPESGQHGFGHGDAADPAQPLISWLADERSDAQALEPKMQLGQSRIDMLA
jgi:flagellar hook-length control protein FliK